MTRIAPKTLRHGVFRALHLFLTAESNESELLEEPSFCESCCELSRTSERERLEHGAWQGWKPSAGAAVTCPLCL